MDHKENKPTRRVSFAPDPQINYIYQDESTTTKTSSFYSDVPMDITTELADLKNLNLFTMEENSEFYNEKTNTRRESLAPGNIPRMSLSPLDRVYFNYEHQNEKNEDSFESHDTTSDFSKSSNSIINEESNKGQSLFWNAAVCDKPKQSLDGSFDNQGTINSSFGVDELVNTIDLRKIIPQDTVETPEITEFLASQGIRFLDETAIDGMKRDTLSKSRNVVDPSLIIYYQYSFKERIDFLFNFSNFLIDKMSDLQREIELVKSTIDIKSINKDNLKRIRNDSRNKSKIDWYSLRKIYEIQFNKKILENRNKVSDILETIRKDEKRTKDSIISKTNSIDSLKYQVEELKTTVSQVDRQSMQKTGDLREMIDERKKVLASAKAELESKKQISDMQTSEETNVQKRIVKLQCEIGNLKKNLSVKSVGESQLEEIRKMINRYSTMYNFKIIKMACYSFIFEIESIEITLELNSAMEVSRFSIQSISNDPFSEFTCSAIDCLTGMKLPDFIKKCIELCSIIQSLKKEIILLKERTRIECSYSNTAFYLRIFPSLGTECFDLYISKSFDLVFEGQVIDSVKLAPGILSAEIISKLNN